MVLRQTDRTKLCELTGLMKRMRFSRLHSALCAKRKFCAPHAFLVRLIYFLFGLKPQHTQRSVLLVSLIRNFCPSIGTLEKNTKPLFYEHEKGGEFLFLMT